MNLPPEPPECPVLVWHHCYDEGWKGIITDDSFAHPAKMARGLLRRIIGYLFERQWIREGDILGEPFGGIGTTAIEGTYVGLRVISNELEPKFCALAAANFALHRSKWESLGMAMPVFLQGDSRRFDQIVDGMLTSPPFTMDQPCASQSRLKGEIGGRAKRDAVMVSEGNIQQCQHGDLDASITSPPYATIAAGAGGLNHLPSKEEGQQSGRLKGPSQDADTRYGAEPGQIAGTAEGSLDAALTSPPFRDARSETTRPGPSPDADGHLGDGRIHRLGAIAYGDAEGQIDNLKTGELDAALTSPPWEDNSEGHVGAHKWADPKKAAAAMSANGKGNFASPEARERQFARDAEKTYGESPGQIGKERKESYWSAMRQVYEALHRCLKPGGVACIVVKDYCRDGKRVRLCDDTLRLLCWIGFEPVERIRAMLVHETEHDDLFDGPVVKTKQRKSFFRRIYEDKLPPGDERRIDYEEVLIVRR